MGMAWFKHLIGDSQFVDELIIEHGSEGYYVYYRTIEIMAENYNIEKPAENLFHWEYYFAKFHRIHKNKIIKVLATCTEKYISTKGKKGIYSEERHKHIYLKCMKLKELADRWTKETVRKLSSNDTVASPQQDGIDKDIDKDIDKEEEKKPSKKPYVASNEARRLAEQLKKGILSNNPKALIKDANWHKVADLLLVKDRRPYEEIYNMILWCQKDDFWHMNILSMGKLRKQYDVLYLKMKGKGQDTTDIMKGAVNR